MEAEKIVFNRSAYMEKVLNAYLESIKTIKKCFADGQEKVHLYINKEVAADVKELIEKNLKQNNIKFYWDIVDRRPNEFTGKMQSFASMTIGDDRYYVLVYNG